MIRTLACASLLALALPVAAAAQPAAVQEISGTRLDVVATGEVTRVPDVARISAGVITRAATATEALRLNAQRMNGARRSPPRRNRRPRIQTSISAFIRLSPRREPAPALTATGDQRVASDPRPRPTGRISTRSSPRRQPEHGRAQTIARSGARQARTARSQLPTRAEL